MGSEEENDGDEEEDSKGSNGDNAYGEDMESMGNAERHFTAAITPFVMFFGAKFGLWQYANFGWKHQRDRWE